MPLWRKSLLVTASVVAIATASCMQAEKNLKYFGDEPLQYYRDKAQTIDTALVETPISSAFSFDSLPRTISDRSKDAVRDIPLSEAIELALKNNPIIRTGTIGSPGALYRSPGSVASIYDSAIQETGVLFGGRGIEAALAAFDTKLTSSMVWGRNENVQNNVFFGGGLGGGSTLVRETGEFTAGLSKQFATGGQFTLNHQWNYSGVNVPGQLFPSAFSGFLQAQYRQPLLAGAGTAFTRTAGPIGQSFSGLSGVTQGVSIARINSDLTLADFELEVRDLVRNVERAYWNLYLQYRLYDTEVTARNSALKIWRIKKITLDIGGRVGDKVTDETQTRERLFATRAAAQAAHSQLYTREVELRRLLGLSINDGKILRPSDEPITAKFVPDWRSSVTEALTERVELRRQKWSIKSLQLQLKAANSLTRPRLDFVSGYQVNAFGDHLFGSNDNDGITEQGFHSAYETLTQGNHTGWNLGLVMTVDVGFRSANAQVRNIELRLAKARDVLSTQEMETTYELATVFQNLNLHYTTSRTNLNRLRAAEENLLKFRTIKEGGAGEIDDVLRAMTLLAAAKRVYHESLTNYVQSIADLHYYKGTLLEYNNVHLSEGRWLDEAYPQALRRAWARTHAYDALRLRTEPEEFVGGGFEIERNESDLEPEDDMPDMSPDEPEAKPKDEEEDKSASVEQAKHVAPVTEVKSSEGWTATKKKTKKKE